MRYFMENEARLLPHHQAAIDKLAMDLHFFSMMNANSRR
jgi:hypothetical protein